MKMFDKVIEAEEIIRDEYSFVPMSHRRSLPTQSFFTLMRYVISFEAWDYHEVVDTDTGVAIIMATDHYDCSHQLILRMPSELVSPFKSFFYRVRDSFRVRKLCAKRQLRWERESLKL